MKFQKHVFWGHDLEHSLELADVWIHMCSLLFQKPPSKLQSTGMCICISYIFGYHVSCVSFASKVEPNTAGLHLHKIFHEIFVISVEPMLRAFFPVFLPLWMISSGHFPQSQAENTATPSSNSAILRWSSKSFWSSSKRACSMSPEAILLFSTAAKFSFSAKLFGQATHQISSYISSFGENTSANSHGKGHLRSWNMRSKTWQPGACTKNTWNVKQQWRRQIRSQKVRVCPELWHAAQRDMLWLQSQFSKQTINWNPFTALD